MKLRPFSGSARACSPVTRPETSAPTVLTATAATSTSTTSLTSPVCELDVDRARVGDVQRDLAADLGLEAGLLDLDAVAADGQLREGVDAGRVRGGRAREPGVLVLDGDLRPRDDGAGGVGHRAANGAP